MKLINDYTSGLYNSNLYFNIHQKLEKNLLYAIFNLVYHSPEYSRTKFDTKYIFIFQVDPGIVSVAPGDSVRNSSIV